MDDLVVAAELRELVPELMEAVRAVGDDRPHGIAVERLDRALGQHLVEVLVAHAPRRVAVAALLLAEDGEPDVARLKDPRERDGDLLRAIVERAHAADPEEDVRLLALVSKLPHGRDAH